MNNVSQSKSHPWGVRPPLHRRQYVVDKPFQARLIGTLMAIWLANSAFFMIVFYFFYEGHLQRFYDLVPKPGPVPLLTLPTLYGITIGFVVAFGFVVLAIVGLYMSNQIAGPLYRAKLSMDRVGQGDWSFNLRFRQRDFLRDLPGSFNAMLAGLRQQAESEVDELKMIETCEELAEAKRLVRNLRERREAQLGLPIGESGDPEAEPVSAAVH
ncbi:MAG TPA: hypothetical protein VEK15_21645 [Vicinamibacteria bacterium]|nr:hypothetical protein [Vicinamibacteria bacterium]